MQEWQATNALSIKGPEGVREMQRFSIEAIAFPKLVSGMLMVM